MKIKFSLVFHCALSALVVQSQTPNATAPKYGGWIFSNSSNMGSYDHFKGGNKFPPTTFSNPDNVKYTVPPALQTKLVSLLSIFKEVCPKPFRHTICYNINPVNREAKTYAIPFQFNIGDYPFFYDAKGNLKPINPMSQLGNMYNGYCVVQINSYGTTESSSSKAHNLFQKIDNKNGFLSKNKFKGMNTFVLIPPSFSYADFGKKLFLKTNKDFPTTEPNSKTTNYVNRKIVYRDYTRLSEEVEEKVMLCNGKLPYISLTIDEVIQLMQMKVDYDKSKGDEYAKSMTDEKGYKEKDRTRHIVEYNDAMTVINGLKEVYKNNLQNIAFVNPEYVSSGGITLYYKAYTANEPVKTRKKLEDVFTTNEKIGVQIAYPDAAYYSSTTANDIKTIVVSWSYVTRFPLHKLYGLNYEQELLHEKEIKQEQNKMSEWATPSRSFSDEPNSFMEGMLQRLDWKKLENLLTKYDETK